MRRSLQPNPTPQVGAAMSKAFIRESDDAPEEVVSRPLSPVVPGNKNYLTAGGERRLREELAHLREKQGAATADGPASREGPAVDLRVRHLERILRTAEVISVPVDGDDRVRFGATVTVRDSTGIESNYRIVGVEEADADRSWVTWQSPIARALLNHRPGEKILFTFPSGETELEIVSVRYEEDR
jgi:transcription elongation factor GreB